jgi:pilus assembly protein Flp/PilA
VSCAKIPPVGFPAACNVRNSNKPRDGSASYNFDQFFPILLRLSLRDCRPESNFNPHDCGAGCYIDEFTRLGYQPENFFFCNFSNCTNPYRCETNSRSIKCSILACVNGGGLTFSRWCVGAHSSGGLQLGELQMEVVMGKLLIGFLRDESGATAIEYGLIAAGIAVVIIAAVQLVGSNLNGTFGSVATAVAAP